MIKREMGKGAVLGGAQCQHTGQYSCQTKSPLSTCKLIFPGAQLCHVLENIMKTAKETTLSPRSQCG